jgi:hypothetical protein
MTNYADVPQTNVLYGELERTQQALSNINAGAALYSFVVGAPPTPTGLQPVSPTAAPPQAMPVTITLDVPPSAALMSDLTAWLTQRVTDLSNQLAALGVPDAPSTPPARKAA